jgi:hypothetical protein
MWEDRPFEKSRSKGFSAQTAEKCCHCEEQFLQRSNLSPTDFMKGEIATLRSQ